MLQLVGSYTELGVINFWMNCIESIRNTEIWHTDGSLNFITQIQCCYFDSINWALCHRCTYRGSSTDKHAVKNNEHWKQGFGDEPWYHFEIFVCVIPSHCIRVVLPPFFFLIETKGKKGSKSCIHSWPVRNPALSVCPNI